MLTTIASYQTAAASEGLIHNQEANRLGLERAWFKQIRVDRNQHHVANWTLDRNELFAVTTDGTVQAVDAETGKTLWISEVSGQIASAAGMAVNSEIVAVLTATRLHLLDRTDGRMLSYRVLGGAPSDSPALSNRIAYVALHSGRIEGYELDSPYASVWQYQSSGRCFQSPTTTGTVVSWPTTGGLLYVASAEDERPLFRIRTNDEIIAAPAEQAPYLYVASLDGYLYCFHELTGYEKWRYSTGFAVTSKPAIVNKTAFVASEEPSLHAVEAASGKRLWQVAGIDQFAGVSANFAYGVDRFGALYVLDRKLGTILGHIPTATDMSAIVNDQSDRIFLVNDFGLVQCLRETGAKEPTWYRQSEDKKTDEEPVDEDNPFAADQPAGDTFETQAPEENVFAPEETDEPEEESPFFFD